MFRKNATSKRLIAMLMAAAIAVSLAACDKDSKKESTVSNDTAQIVPFEDEQDDASVVAFDDTEEEETTATTTTTTGTTAKATKAVPKRDNSYQITAVEYAKNGKSGSYPQISGLYDEEMQAYYNNLFKSDFENGLNDDTIESGTIQYQVTLKNKDILSIVFRCTTYATGAAHPYGYAYAYTIDLKTGETLIPSSTVDIDNAAHALLTGKGWTLTRSTDGVGKSDIMEYYNAFDVETIKTYITETDVMSVKRSAKGKYSMTGTISCRSYLDGSADPVMILDVNHGLGDYAEVQFD